MTCTLDLLPGPYAVCRLAAADALPARPAAAELWSITLAGQEVSLVAEQRYVDSTWACERDWRCLRVRGPLDFALVGVLHALLEPLALTDISVFALSTYDTDYVLVQEASLSFALSALSAAGHTIVLPV